MGKYIIDIDEKNIFSDDNGSQLVISVKVNDASAIFCTEIPLMPYTEDIDDVKKEAYQQGHKDGKIEGQSETWEAARKIGSNSMCSLKEMGFDFSQCVVNDYNPSWFVIKNYSVSECIEKIRQYEQRREEIQVGDEVTMAFGKAVVTGVGPVHFEYVYTDGSHGYDKVGNVKKTGRHFTEIAEVLAKMKEES